jgi:hypothetical protein
MLSKRKQRSENFDVTEFLRPTDTDLKSALTSLLTPSVGDNRASAEAAIVQPDTLTNTATPGSGSHVNAAPGSLHDPGAKSKPESDYIPVANKDSTHANDLQNPQTANDPSFFVNTAPGSLHDPDVIHTPEPEYAPVENKDLERTNDRQEPQDSKDPSFFDNIAPGSGYEPGLTYDPASLLIPDPLFAPGSGLQTAAAANGSRFRVRRMKRAQDAHTPTEQLMYEFLWKTAAPKDDVSRMITIGLAGIMRALGLSKNGARAALRSLIKKLAVEEQRTYRCEDHTAITYRVLSYQEILRQRKERGMTWYMKRTQAVIFVDPTTGLPFESTEFTPNTAPGSNIEPVSNHISGSGQGLPRGANNAPAPNPRYDRDPGSEYAPLYRERSERNSFREEKADSKVSPSSTAPRTPTELTQGLLHIFPFIDNEAVTILWAECTARAADCTVGEVLYFSHQKAAICRNGRIQNPTGFLLAAVPKCFDGQAFTNFREEQIKLKEAERKSEEGKREQAQRLADETRREEESYHRAEERLQALGKLEYDALYARAEKELKALVPKLGLWTPEARQQNIRSRMIAEIQRRERQQEPLMTDSAAAK